MDRKPKPNGCLTDDELKHLRDGSLPAGPLRRAVEHVRGCAECQARTKDAAATGTLSLGNATGPVGTQELNATGPVGTQELSAPGHPEVRSANLERGTGLGRYVVLEKLGEGGMGVVYSAYDPDLDRKVALKLLRAEVSPDQADHKRARLLREAQAMARLSHPNVITVFDVGMLAGRVFVAMEHVDGATLRRWLQVKTRPWQEALSTLLSAGRGLAAAHAAGMVHRDFKPDNVLIGKDGRVHVTDFGLARPLPQTDSAGASASTGLLEVVITSPGTVVGTPAYMAPEILEHREIDARSDQFSFCVALYEALYDQRPWKGHGFAELKPEILAGRVRPPPASSPVPAYVRKAVLKGLSTRPEDRFPSMDALLRTLERDPRAAWRRGLLLSAAGLGVALVAGGAVAAKLRDPPVCQGAAARLAGIWDEGRKASVHQAFRATGKPFAADAWSAVERSLDAYARDWVAGHTDACQATRVRKEQTEAMMEVRMLCLDRRRQELDALTSLFASADAQSVERAVQASRALTPVKGCADLAALSSRVPLPEDPEARPKVEAVRQQLARAKATMEAAKYAAALGMVDAALQTARQLRFRPLEAEALAQQGLLRWHSQDLKGADGAFAEAILAAEAGRHPEAAARAWVERVGVMGDLHDPVAHEHAKHAWAMLEALGNDDRLQARLRMYLGTVALSEDRYPDAKAEYQAAVALVEKAIGPDEPLLASAYNNFALMLDRFGEHEESLAYHRRALAIYEKALGPEHPQCGRSLSNIGIVLYEQGKYEEALAAQRRALALQERALGEGVLIALTVNNIGNVLMDEGRLEEAAGQFERSVRIWEKVSKGSHQGAFPLSNLGTVRLRQGRPQEAAALHREAISRMEKVAAEYPELCGPLTAYSEDLVALGRFPEAQRVLERARAIAERKLGPSHFRVGEALSGMALSLSAQGRHRDALRKFEEALAVREKALGARSVVLATDLTGIGQSHLALGDVAAARLALERAVALRESAPVDPTSLAESRFALARALGAKGGDVARARALAEQAREGFSRAAQLRRRELAEVAAWLARAR